MAYKKQKILLSTAGLLLSSLLFSAEPALSAPFALEDSAMDQVTAGNATEGGGVVAGNSSEVVASRTTGLDLSGEAQRGAKGLNIVNSAESAVANVVNIWDGSGVTAVREATGTNSEVEINQANKITQEQVRSAVMSGYLRPEADQTEVLSRSGSERSTSKIVDSHATTNIFEETRTSETAGSAEVNTRIKFNVGDKISLEANLGQGVAVAGHADIVIDGGSADLAMVLGGGISDRIDIGGDLVVAGINLGDTGVTAGIDASVSVSMLLELELPTMKIEIDGAGCGVVMGSCKASSTFSEKAVTMRDNSTLDIIENYQSGQSSYSEVKTSVYRSPFELKSARAEYIVVDNSSLELDSDVTLELSDSAQKDVKGMNLVNAIGSNVANATNISRTARFEGLRSKLLLNQTNIVHHGR